MSTWLASAECDVSTLAMLLDQGPENLALPTSRSEWINMLRERISQGIEPNYIGELVREGLTPAR